MKKFKKLFKRKNLNYKKVGYTHPFIFWGCKIFDSKNIEFKSVLVNIDYFLVVYELFLFIKRYLMIRVGDHVLVYMS